MIEKFEAPAKGVLKPKHRIERAIKSLYKQAYAKVPNMVQVGMDGGYRNKIKEKLAGSPRLRPRRAEEATTTKRYTKEELVARQLGRIGDKLNAKQQPIKDQKRGQNKMAVSLLVVGVAGVAVLMLTREAE